MSILNSSQNLYLQIYKEKDGYVDALHKQQLSHEEKIKEVKNIELKITNLHKKIKELNNMLANIKLLNPKVHTTLEHRKLN